MARTVSRYGQGYKRSEAIQITVNRKGSSHDTVLFNIMLYTILTNDTG